jgi:hypothetical protein
LGGSSKGNTLMPRRQGEGGEGEEEEEEEAATCSAPAAFTMGWEASDTLADTTTLDVPCVPRVT